jgi:peptidoglycan/LPS O-acetylase OafA/YrhL
VNAAVPRQPIAPSTYYPWFDWLRLALAAIVLISHQGLIPVWPQAADFAVQIFFALSGWLIGGMLLTLPRKELSRFYFNRALRIWCPYFLALSLFAAASLLRDPVTPKWTEFMLYKATFVYNLFGVRQLDQHKAEMPLAGTGNHFWSVNAEEQFYLLAPLLLVLVPARYGRSVAVWTVIAALAWFSRLYASIAFGVLAAIGAQAFGAFHRQALFRILAGVAVVFSIIGLLSGLNYELLAPICAIAIVLLMAVEGKQHPLGGLAGGMSYPLYLNAWIPAFFVNAIFKRTGLDNPFARHGLILILSFCLAAFLYWNFDRRILTARRWLYTPRRAQAVVAVAYGIVATGLCLGLFRYRE